MSDDETLIAAFVVLLVGFGSLLAFVVRAERHPRFVARWVTLLSGPWQAPPSRAARMLLPSMLFTVALLGGLGVIVVVGQSMSGRPDRPKGAFLALVILWMAVVSALGLAMIVVGRTGRPVWLVMKPIRGMTPDQIEDWIDTHADWEQVRRARRRRRD